MKTTILILAALLLSGCNDSIVGTWTSETPGDDGATMTFKRDGRFVLSKADGSDATQYCIKWDTITEVTPHQLYVTNYEGIKSCIDITPDTPTRRVPFGIYNLTAEKLVLRLVTVYNNTLGGYAISESRRVFPDDFNGTDVSVFRRH